MLKAYLCQCPNFFVFQNVKFYFLNALSFFLFQQCSKFVDDNAQTSIYSSAQTLSQCSKLIYAIIAQTLDMPTLEVYLRTCSKCNYASAKTYSCQRSNLCSPPTQGALEGFAVAAKHPWAGMHGGGTGSSVDSRPSKSCCLASPQQVLFPPLGTKPLNREGTRHR